LSSITSIGKSSGLIVKKKLRKSPAEYLFPENTLNQEKSVGRASVPAAFGGTGFPAYAQGTPEAGFLDFFR
jgi:hypothetical protein